MDGSIGHLHCRYRLIGASTDRGVTHRLDTLAREQVAECWAQVLDANLGDDPTVYVLRRVDATFAVAGDGGGTDAQLSQRWGRELATAVLRSISTDRQDGENLATFENTGEYVAQFCGDLLGGKAWGLWYYCSFNGLRGLPTHDALREVLLQHEQHLAAVLAALHRHGSLLRVLRALDDATLQLLWRAGLATTPDDDIAEEFRPLVEAAVRIVREVGLSGPLPSVDEIASSLAGAVPSVDWRDSLGPTDGVLAIIRHLASRGHLNPLSADAMLIHLDRALEGLSWLDSARLSSELTTLLPGAEVDTTVQRPRADRATPRQRELLETLTAICRDASLGLDAVHPRSTQNALHIYAALVAKAPQWADDPTATSMIEALLASWAVHLATGGTGDTLRRAANGEVAGVLAGLSPELRARARPALQSAARLGRSFVEAAQALASPAGTSTHDGDYVESPCAGLLLLARAAMDSRLHSLAAAAVPERSSEAFLTSIALTLAGESWAAGPNGNLAVSLFAGTPSSYDTGRMLDHGLGVGETDLQRWQRSIFGLVIGQRLLGDTLQAHWISQAGRSLILAGGQGAYPFGRVVESVDEAASLVIGWLEVWQDLYGAPPEAVLLPPELASILGARDGFVAVPQADDASEDELTQTYRREAAALEAALQALIAPPFDRPDLALTVSLSALTLLRVWSRWLRQFASSGAPYLLDNFIRRPGRLLIDEETIVVELNRQPLDIVLEMAGYLSELENVPWLDNRKLQFRFGGA